jgi:alkanesulfonate monooxygenase SsuD/methylene tetrahydromethanopterin reductase-like flavin-dependent oxidoreductase (luciferase family)
MERDLFLPVAAQPSVETLVDYARLAEDLGYDRAWLPETWGRDAVTTLTTVAERTDDIGIGTSVVNVYSRSPALLGQTATTLQEVSDGRFRLGLGPSGPVLVEGWHGMEYDRPLRRTREYVEVVRQVLTGETVEYDGDLFQLSGFRLRCSPPDAPPGIDAGGMGPKSVELAGRFADGWHALMLTREALARQGYEDTAHEVASEWANGNQDAAMAAIPAELLDALGVAGTPEACRDRFDAWTDLDGVDAVSVSFPRGAEPDEIRTTMRALAPA